MTDLYNFVIDALDYFFRILLPSAIRLATPLLLAALGGLFSERAGVINIALEGLLLAGAFTAAAVTWYAGSPWVGLVSAVLAGAAIAGVHAVACIRYRADQVVSGTAINILLVGVPALLSGAFFLSSGSTPQVPKEDQIPYTPMVIAGVLVPLTYYVLYYTPFGLRLRAVGENPEAADAAGVSVKVMRYAAVLLSGALAGIGGAYLSIGQSSLFTRNMSAGRGFIALAALIFGKWRPVQTMLACLLFGFTEAVAIQLQGVAVRPSIILTASFIAILLAAWLLIRTTRLKRLFMPVQILIAAVLAGVVFLVLYYYKLKSITGGEEIPNQFIQIIPYVLTIVVLAGFIGTSRAPRALGIPYQKEK